MGPNGEGSPSEIKNLSDLRGFSTTAIFSASLLLLSFAEIEIGRKRGLKLGAEILGKV